jgi:hypothetical protein
MRRTLEDPTGILEWSSHIWTLSTSAVAHWDFSAAKPFKVIDAAKELYQQGRYRYRLSGAGRWCSGKASPAGL